MDLIGLTIGGYEVREKLGNGAMGSVYRAWETSLEREVAFKVMLPSFSAEETSQSRFIQEAKRIARLEHAHIVPIYKYGVENIRGESISFIAMRLLDGGTLEEHRNALSRDYVQLAKITRQLADALEYAHQRGIIHRDLKPSNVMFDHKGDNASPFLVDFGIAKTLNPNTLQTEPGLVLGTPYYMPPEQWSGTGVSPQTDQYAFAIMLYYILTGKHPIEGNSPYELMNNHHNMPPMSLRALNSQYSKELEGIFQRALAKNPDQRFPSIRDFTQAFAAEIEKSTPTKTTAVRQPTASGKAPSDDETKRLGSTKNLPSEEPPPSPEPDIPIAQNNYLSNRYIRNLIGVALAAPAMLVIFGLGVHFFGAAVLQQVRCTFFPQDVGGGRIVFATGGKLVTMDANNPCNQRTLIEGNGVQNPAWSPDGSKILFSRHSETPFVSDLFVVNADGSNETRITKTSDISEEDSSWSADGSQIAYEARPAASQLVNVGQSIYRISSISPYTPIPGQVDYGIDPDWSPDGRIAFTRNRPVYGDIYVSSADGTNAIVLTNSGKAKSPIWSPDGSQIAYIQEETYESNYINYIRNVLWVMDADGSNPVPITQEVDVRGGIAWSPDGTHIAFAAFVRPYNPVYIYTVDISGLKNGKDIPEPIQLTYTYEVPVQYTLLGLDWAR